ncbi:MAG: hypothetical protein M3680_29335 [Myxococcota bacterium]|nr:hypothetical protein [Myxococcota bacterium]
MKLLNPVVVLVLALVVPLGGCSLYFGGDDPAARPDGGGGGGGGGGPGELTGTFQLKKTRAIAGEYPVAGIDSDGAGGVWIAYRLQRGDYYTPDEVHLVHLDANGVKLADHVSMDESTDVSGIAVAGDALWVNYGGKTGNNEHVRKVDAATGERLASYATEDGIVDIDVHGDELRLSNLWNQIISLDVATGGENWRAPVAGFQDSTQRGITTMPDGRMWVASWFGESVYLLDAQHQLLGSGVIEALGYNHTIDVGLFLAWDGQQLIVVIDNQIIWFTPVPS